MFYRRTRRGRRENIIYHFSLCALSALCGYISSVWAAGQKVGLINCTFSLSIFNSAPVRMVLKKALSKLKILVTKAGGAKKLGFTGLFA